MTKDEAQHSRWTFYEAVKNLVQHAKVKEVTFQGDRITGQFSRPLTEEMWALEEDEGSRVYEPFKTIRPDLEDKDIDIHAEAEPENWWRLIFAGLLPWLLIVGLIVYSAKRFRGGMGAGGGPFGFGKSKAKLYTREMIKVGYHAGRKGGRKDCLSRCFIRGWG